MIKSISIGEVSEILGVHNSTLRRWEKEGKLLQNHRTFGGHRRYDLNKILNLITKGKNERINVIYSRVSSVGQKPDLKYQTEILEKYCKENEINNIKIIEDLGSGINFKKKGLKVLINLIINSKIDKIIITHKDRLLRFGTELIISIAKEFHTEVVILNNKIKTFEEELSSDVIEILTVFSARLYGKRSHKNKKQL